MAATRAGDVASVKLEVADINSNADGFVWKRGRVNIEVSLDLAETLGTSPKF